MMLDLVCTFSPISLIAGELRSMAIHLLLLYMNTGGRTITKAGKRFLNFST